MRVGSSLLRSAILVATLLIERPACACDPAQANAVVLYPEEDNQDGRRNVERLQLAAAALRGSRQRCVQLVHVPIRFDDPDLKDAIGRYSGRNPAAVVAGSGIIAFA